MKKPILIASSTADEHAYDPVASILERSGFPVIVYRTDKVLTGEERLSVEVTSGGEFLINYNGQPITADKVSAAWYRKVGSFSIQSAEQDVAKQLYINNEVRHLHDTIWPLFPDDIWLNAPNKIAHADRKLWQLMVAQEVGFSIPRTVVGNDWDDISSKLLTGNGQMVVKMLRGVIAENNHMKGMYTTLLDKDKVQQLRNYTTPFPGLYQPFVEKAREWRITTVGDNVFATAIYTEKSAKDDWRKYQMTEAVQFEDEVLPEGVGEKCIQYLKSMGLKYGAFDLIEKPDGELVFLECNPNGQYGWLEEKLGFPISNAIADELMKIATTRAAL